MIAARHLALAATAGALSLASAAPAAAQAQAPVTESDAQETSPLAPSVVARAAESGQFLPLTAAATVGQTAAVASGYAGYDGALGAVMESHAEVRLWGPIALRGAAELGDTSRRVRPSIGARAQLLSQARHGVDGALSVTYRAEGFTEGEGEIETLVALGRRIGATTLLANLAYGQDPEGNERDGELRASLLRTQGRGVYGLEARGRSAIGPQHGSNSAVEPRADAVGGLVGMLSLRTFALYAEVGPSTVKLPGADFRWGVASWAGVATIF